MAFIRNSAFHYNKIWVVESLPKHEKQTGTILFNDLIKRKTDQSNILTSALEPVNRKRNLVRFLKRVEDYVEQKAQLPYLHFEVHGSRTGLELASGETMSWEELAGYLRNINIATRNNLVVSLASCYGGYMFTEISPIVEAPFCGIIGPLSKVGMGEIEEGFYNFFENMLTGDGLENAIQALNEVNPSNPKFQFVPAEAVFESVSLDLQKMYQDPVFRKNKVYELTDRALKNRTIRNSRSIWSIQAAIEDFIQHDRPLVMAQLREHFLMKDLPALDFSNTKKLKQKLE
ncbi:hypothetical protein K3G63_06745 [Hymenobacter sp. HSC-4F20]|uniref:hypothetical protein n=1 Tax=Hymenobacter sp. HSC-4F20 TaxID=2864135 RepID=UPI001C7315D4|nr:hypothetical protein [Hymenobacter sp. HSC-4F20]MBX0290129.1 hypothetical protein [Hymenobacter sp. HSC-4F20]